MHKKLLALILVVTFSSVAFAGQIRPLFTDTTLNDLLFRSAISQTSGVIYTWSPRMNLSLLGIAELQSICNELKLELVILLDPAISDEEANSVRKPFYEYLIPSYRLHSAWLLNMGIRVHYPSLVIFKNGKIIGSFRPGYDEPGRVRQYLLRRLQ